MSSIFTLLVLASPALHQFDLLDAFIIRVRLIDRSCGPFCASWFISGDLLFVDDELPVGATCGLFVLKVGYLLYLSW